MANVGVAPEGAAKPGKPSPVIDTRVIHCGDNLEQLKKLPDGCIDLIYIGAFARRHMYIHLHSFLL
jgi:hypothetical protein